MRPVGCVAAGGRAGAVASHLLARTSVLISCCGGVREHLAVFCAWRNLQKQHSTLGLLSTFGLGCKKGARVSKNLLEAPDSRLFLAVSLSCGIIASTWCGRRLQEVAKLQKVGRVGGCPFCARNFCGRARAWPRIKEARSPSSLSDAGPSSSSSTCPGGHSPRPPTSSRLSFSLKLLRPSPCSLFVLFSFPGCMRARPFPPARRRPAKCTTSGGAFSFSTRSS